MTLHYFLSNEEIARKSGGEGERVKDSGREGEGFIQEYELSI